MAATIRDRIKDLRRVKARDLIAHPLNYLDVCPSSSLDYVANCAWRDVVLLCKFFVASPKLVRLSYLYRLAIHEFGVRVSLAPARSCLDVVLSVLCPSHVLKIFDAVVRLNKILVVHLKPVCVPNERFADHAMYEPDVPSPTSLKTDCAVSAQHSDKSQQSAYCSPTSAVWRRGSSDIAATAGFIVREGRYNFPCFHYSNIRRVHP